MSTTYLHAILMFTVLTSSCNASYLYSTSFPEISGNDEHWGHFIDPALSGECSPPRRRASSCTSSKALLPNKPTKVSVILLPAEIDDETSYITASKKHAMNLQSILMQQQHEHHKRLSSPLSSTQQDRKRTTLSYLSSWWKRKK